MLRDRAVIRDETLHANRPSVQSVEPRAVIRAAALVVALTAATAGAEPSPTNVELTPVSASSSACADAIASETADLGRAPTCTKLQTLRVRGLGTVEIARLEEMQGAVALVLSIQRSADDRVWTLLSYSPMCSTGTCQSYALRSVRLVQLAPAQDPTVGVEVELINTTEFAGAKLGLGPPRHDGEHDRIACAANAGAVACKQLQLGGHYDDCAPLGWRGPTVRFTCASEAALADP